MSSRKIGIEIKILVPRRSSSKLNPREFVGGFERLAIACVHGEADKRSAPGRQKRTPNSHRAAIGIDRLDREAAIAKVQPEIVADADRKSCTSESVRIRF